MSKKTPRAPKVRIELTQQDIDDGIARDSNHCMYAESMKRSLLELGIDARSVSVDLATMRFTDPKKKLRYIYMTPRVAQVNLVNFDRGVKPEPMALTLRNGHVVRSGKDNKTELTDRQKKAFAETARRLNESKLVTRGNKTRVPDRVGGQAPPLQKSKDDVPFSRRRAFGLRGLEY